MERRTDLMHFRCSPVSDHNCDSDGPFYCGGTHSDGTHWEAEATEENKLKARWGSVTCSVCGKTAIEDSAWL